MSARTDRPSPRLLEREFTQIIQGRVARTFVGASTVRGQGSGVASAAREFAMCVDLRPFATDSRKTFERQLDRLTDGMRQALPPGARTWGLARKLANIFLRNCLYNWHLRKVYALGKAEAFLEVPLDSITTKQIRERSQTDDFRLPRMQSLGNLTRPMSDLYQAEATTLARKRGFHRVHLDALYWGVRRD